MRLIPLGENTTYQETLIVKFINPLEALTPFKVKKNQLKSLTNNHTAITRIICRFPDRRDIG